MLSRALCGSLTARDKMPECLPLTPRKARKRQFDASSAVARRGHIGSAPDFDGTLQTGDEPRQWSPPSIRAVAHQYSVARIFYALEVTATFCRLPDIAPHSQKRAASTFNTRLAPNGRAARWCIVLPPPRYTRHAEPTSLYLQGFAIPSIVTATSLHLVTPRYNLYIV